MPLQQAGHGSIGKELSGVLSLGGKIPNAKRNESKSYEHAEVASIITSLGLEKGAFYNSAKNLRYGHLMLMMDQVRVPCLVFGLHRSICVAFI